MSLVITHKDVFTADDLDDLSSSFPREIVCTLHVREMCVHNSYNAVQKKMIHLYYCTVSVHSG